MTTTQSRCGLDGRQSTSCTKNTMLQPWYLHHSHWLDLTGPDPELGQPAVSHVLGFYVGQAGNL